MPYALLAAAIALEVLGTSFLASTDGFTRLAPTAGVVLAYLASMVLLSQAVRDIPVGVAYALWAGVGTVAIVAISVAFAGEALDPLKAVGVLLVVSGAVMLNLGGAH